MPQYEYICKCGVFEAFNKMVDAEKNMPCPYCGKMSERIFSMPAITGTRDSFGIGKEFKGPNGQVIDTWKKWEKAGYKDAVSSGVASNRHTMRPKELQSMIKRKVKKITQFDNKKRFSVKVGA